MKIAVLGASGAIGKTIVRTSLSRGISVRLVGRTDKKLRAAYGDLAAEYVAVDLSDREGCLTALGDADSAVYTFGLPYTKTAFAVYPAMMHEMIAAARQAQLKRLILITNVYPYGIPQNERVDETHPRNPVAVKGQYRREQEDILLAAHDRYGLHTLSLRLPDFYGPDSELSLTHEIFKAATSCKKANILGPIDTPHEFMFTPDVGPVVVDLLQRDHAFGTAYNFGGPGVLTMQQFAEKVFAAAGCGNPKLNVAQGMLLRLLGVVMPLLRELVEMEYLLKTPVILDDSRLRSVLGELHKTSYDEGIRQTLAEYKKTVLGVSG
jgi:nucleoside-diphosphate-sugar epimerase